MIMTVSFDYNPLCYPHDSDYAPLIPVELPQSSVGGQMQELVLSKLSIVYEIIFH